MTRIIFQWMCSHIEEDLKYQNITNYFDDKTSTVDAQIKCSRCGKIIVSKEQFKIIKSFEIGDK